MSQVVGLDMVTGMGFIGLEPGRLYKIGQSPKLKDQTASGNPLLLNSAEAPLTALSLYGWSKQDGTPTPENPVPIVSAGSVMVESKNLWRNPKPNTLYGVTLSYEGDYVVLNGTCTAAANFQLSENTLFPGEYTISADVQGEVPNNLAPLVQVYSISTGFNIPIPNGNISPVTGTLAETITDAYFRVRIDAGFQYDNVKIRVMLNAGSTALPYEPYFTPYADQDEGEINVTVQGGNLVDIPDIPAGDGGLNVVIPVDISETFTVSVDDSDVIIGGNNVWRLRFEFEDGNLRFAVDGAFPVTVNVTPENKVVNIMYRDIRIESGTYKNFMLNYGSTALPYMPYKTPQTLTAQTPGGLPGIPVSSGGNYTDESGQAWICDEVDFKRGVYVQRTMKYTFDGSDKQAWRMYSNGFYIADALEDGKYTRKPGLSNQFFVRSNAESTLPGLWIGVNNSILYSVYNEFYDDSLPDFGLANWKAHLAAHPLEVMTYLETPIETDLPAEEIAAYKSLHTYSPATTVSNDADVRMGVGYKK